jgi:hypothetical protein
LDRIDGLLDKVMQMNSGLHSEILKDSQEHNEVFSITGTGSKPSGLSLLARKKNWFA